MITPAPQIVGRFAPSPTGPLHMGSLLCAVASYLDCKSKAGKWLLRIEDVDTVREVHGAKQQIIDCLHAHGMQHDGAILTQSDRGARYQEIIALLRAAKRCYPCTCSRKDLQGHPYYPGTCRQRSSASSGFAWRLRTEQCTICFNDELQGSIAQELAHTPGDFVLQRKDKLYAYHLAVVIDDADQGVNRILRGIDLLDCCAPQIYLQQLLQLPQPSYAHIPILVNSKAQKLSKQTYAAAIESESAKQNLLTVLTLLKQKAVPPASQHSILDIVDHALTHWDLSAVKHLQQITYS